MLSTQITTYVIHICVIVLPTIRSVESSFSIGQYKTRSDWSNRQQRSYGPYEHPHPHYPHRRPPPIRRTVLNDLIYSSKHKWDYMRLPAPFVPGGKAKVALRLWIPVTVGTLSNQGRLTQNGFRDVSESDEDSNNHEGKELITDITEKIFEINDYDKETDDQNVEGGEEEVSSVTNIENIEYLKADTDEEEESKTKGSSDSFHPSRRKRDLKGKAAKSIDVFPDVSLSEIRSRYDKSTQNAPKGLSVFKPFLSSLLSNKYLNGGISSRPSTPHRFAHQQQQSLTSFDEIPIVHDSDNFIQGFQVDKRLGRLDSIFDSLRVKSEYCKQRMICEITLDANMYSPLAEIMQQETKIVGDPRDIGRELAHTEDGTRLLSYIDANSRGRDRSRQCDIYRYRCHQSAKELIDLDSLGVWKEVVNWLTVKVLTKNDSPT